MLALGRNILLWLSFSLLLMHSFVPHHHSDHHDCQEKHLSESSTPDNPFSTFLQTQLGEGHLEHFLTEETSDSPSVEFNFVIENNPAFKASKIVVSQNNSFTPTQVFFSSSTLDFQKPLRAPPVLS